MDTRPYVLARRDIFTGDHSPTSVNRHLLYGENALHGHDFFEIALVVGGTSDHVSSTGRQALRPGDVIIIRPGAWHGYINCDAALIFNCCFEHHLLQRELGWLRENPALNYLLWTGPYSGERRGVLMVHMPEGCVQSSLEQLEALRLVEDTPRRAETLGRLLIFLDCLTQTVEKMDVLRQQSRPLHPAVLETLRMLEGQVAAGWSLGELAAHNHLDPSYLARLFKAEMGLAPIAYLNRCRLERAAGMLLHTSLPIAEVAAQVGWFDQNLFARRFRLAYGMSPREYRKRFGV